MKERVNTRNLKPYDVIRTHIRQSDGLSKYRFAVVESVNNKNFTIRPCTSLFRKDEDGSFRKHTINEIKDHLIDLNDISSYGMTYETGIDPSTTIKTAHSDVNWTIERTGHLSDIDKRRFDKADEALIEHLKYNRDDYDYLYEFTSTRNRANELQFEAGISEHIPLNIECEPSIISPQNAKLLDSPRIDFNAPIQDLAKHKQIVNSFKNRSRSKPSKSRVDDIGPDL